MRRLLQLGERYGLDREDLLTRWDYLEKIWLAYGRYQATHEAFEKRASSADEMFDRDTIVQRAKAVAALLEGQVDQDDANKCIESAHDLVLALSAFPVDLRAQAAGVDKDFMDTKLALESTLIRVALWPRHREEFLTHLNHLIAVCGQLEQPKIRTKPRLVARQELAQTLESIYLEILHPDRMAAWGDYRAAHPDEVYPPPPESTEAFALGVMSLLEVPFESKGVSG